MTAGVVCAGVPAAGAAGHSGLVVLRALQGARARREEAGPVEPARAAGGAPQALLVLAPLPRQARCPRRLPPVQPRPLLLCAARTGAARAHTPILCLLSLLSLAESPDWPALHVLTIRGGSDAEECDWCVVIVSHEDDLHTDLYPVLAGTCIVVAGEWIVRDIRSRKKS